jgi:hypothetical protein
VRPALRPALVVAAAAAACVLRAGPPAAAQDAPADTPAAREAAESAAVVAATKEYERRLGTTLRVARRDPFVVRGDLEQADLERLAELALATLEDYTATMRVTASDVLRPQRKGETPRVEVFQFRQEKGYLDFLDKVFSRLRDDTVDDRRLALMRRQRGFFVLTPRPLVVQYQGPSELATCASQVVHKTSHVLVLVHRRAGAWMPWWFLEGLATRQEMSVLKESRTYCLEIDRPGDYAKPGTPEADEAAKARLESHWRRAAREMVESRRHRDLATLAKLSLNELTFDDVVQSWSVVDWILREGRLPAFTIAYKDHRDFAKTCEAALGSAPAGVEVRWTRDVTGAK